MCITKATYLLFFSTEVKKKKYIFHHIYHYCITHRATVWVSDWPVELDELFATKSGATHPHQSPVPSWRCCVPQSHPHWLILSLFALHVLKTEIWRELPPLLLAGCSLIVLAQGDCFEFHTPRKRNPRLALPWTRWQRAAGKQPTPPSAMLISQQSLGRINEKLIQWWLRELHLWIQIDVEAFYRLPSPTSAVRCEAAPHTSFLPKLSQFSSRQAELPRLAFGFCWPSYWYTTAGQAYQASKRDEKPRIAIVTAVPPALGERTKPGQIKKRCVHPPCHRDSTDLRTNPSWKWLWGAARDGSGIPPVLFKGS